MSGETSCGQAPPQPLYLLLVAFMSPSTVQSPLYRVTTHFSDSISNYCKYELQFICISQRNHKDVLKVIITTVSFKHKDLATL